jgi:hypothetical protein
MVVSLRSTVKVTGLLTAMELSLELRTELTCTCATSHTATWFGTSKTTRKFKPELLPIEDISPEFMLTNLELLKLEPLPLRSKELKPKPPLLKSLPPYVRSKPPIEELKPSEPEDSPTRDTWLL